MGYIYAHNMSYVYEYLLVVLVGGMGGLGVGGLEVDDSPG